MPTLETDRASDLVINLPRCGGFTLSGTKNMAPEMMRA